MNFIISKMIYQNYSIGEFLFSIILCSVILTNFIDAQEIKADISESFSEKKYEGIEILDSLLNLKKSITVNLETYYWLQKETQVKSFQGRSSKSLIGMLDHANRMLVNINKIITKVENHQNSEIKNILSELLRNLEGILDGVEKLSDDVIANSNNENPRYYQMIEDK